MLYQTATRFNYATKVREKRPILSVQSVYVYATVRITSPDPGVHSYLPAEWADPEGITSPDKYSVIWEEEEEGSPDANAPAAWS